MDSSPLGFFGDSIQTSRGTVMQTIAYGRSEILVLDHTADFGIVVRSPDLAILFEDAAGYMMQMMVVPLEEGVGRDFLIEVKAADLEDLMVRWLGEILYNLEGEGQIVTSVRIEAISPGFLSAVVKRTPFDPKIHEILCEIKAVTYHQIEVREQGDHWESRIIFDL